MKLKIQGTEEYIDIKQDEFARLKNGGWIQRNAYETPQLPTILEKIAADSAVPFIQVILKLHTWLDRGGACYHELRPVGGDLEKFLMTIAKNRNMKVGIKL